MNWFYAEVNRPLLLPLLLPLLDLETGKSTTPALPQKGFARLLEPRDGSYLVAAFQWEPRTVEFSRLVDGDMQLIDRLESGSVRSMVAVGSDTIVLSPPRSDAPALEAVVRVDLVTGQQALIEGLVEPRLAVTFLAGTEITALPPVPAPTTTVPDVPVTTTEEQTTTLVEGTPDTREPVEPQAQPSTTPAEGGSSGWPVIAGIAAIVTLGVAAGVWILRSPRSNQENPAP